MPAPKRASTMGTPKKTNTASTPRRSATEPTVKKPKRTDTADPLPNFYDCTGKDKKKNFIKEVMTINDMFPIVFGEHIVTQPGFTLEKAGNGYKFWVFDEERNTGELKMCTAFFLAAAIDAVRESVEKHAKREKARERLARKEAKQKLHIYQELQQELRQEIPQELQQQLQQGKEFSNDESREDDS